MFFDAPVTGRRAARQNGTPHVRLWLARFVWMVHLGVVGFFVVGWLLPWRWALWGVAAGVPTLQLIWWAMEDRCPLTVLEEALRGSRGIPCGAPDDGLAPPNFVTRLLTAMLGRPVSQRVSDRVVNGVAWSGFSVAVVRLAF